MKQKEFNAHFIIMSQGTLDDMSPDYSPEEVMEKITKKEIDASYKMMLNHALKVFAINKEDHDTWNTPEEAYSLTPKKI